MDTHPVDPVALVSGLLFGLSGLAILAHQRWEDVDVTAFTAAGVTLVGLLLAGMIVVRVVSRDITAIPDVDNGDAAGEA
jgi:hypothetical protein